MPPEGSTGPGLRHPAWLRRGEQRLPGAPLCAQESGGVAASIRGLAPSHSFHPGELRFAASELFSALLLGKWQARNSCSPGAALLRSVPLPEPGADLGAGTARAPR